MRRLPLNFKNVVIDIKQHLLFIMPKTLIWRLVNFWIFTGTEALLDLEDEA